METQVIPTFNEFNFSSFKMPMIVVYDHPIDCPAYFVARLFDFEKRTKYAIVANNLDELQENIPQHFAKLNRQNDDDPAILEVWI